MKFLSLFDGISGFIIAGERSGMSCIARCEIDEKCNSLAKVHYPNLETIEDVRNVGKHNIGSADLICGGFPCQDVSIAGKRAGLAGERSGLWWEFARIIDELEPKWVVAENVPGLLSSNKGRDFAAIIHWLAQRGYGVSWRILDAQYFGVPQRRRRVFIVASFGNGSCAEVLFERENMRGDITSSKRKGDETSGGSDSNFGKRSVLNDQGGSRMSVSTERTSTLRHSEHGHQPIVWDFHGQDGTYRPQSHTAPTVVSAYGTGGNNMPFVGARRMTPTECERLQGFPSGWTEGQCDSTRYKQLGNAVAVPVVEWIMRRIALVEAQ